MGPASLRRTTIDHPAHSCHGLPSGTQRHSPFGLCRRAPLAALNCPLLLLRSLPRVRVTELAGIVFGCTEYKEEFGMACRSLLYGLLSPMTRSVFKLLCASSRTHSPCQSSVNVHNQRDSRHADCPAARIRRGQTTTRWNKGKLLERHRFSLSPPPDNATNPGGGESQCPPGRRD